MARKLETFDFPKAGGRAIRPWDEWFDGNIWELKQGVDFDGDTRKFRQSLSSKAHQRGHKVRTSVVDDATIVIQAWGVK